MTPQEKECIIRFNSTLCCHVRIGLLRSDGDAGKAFSAFCSDLSRLASKIDVEEKKPGDIDAPAIEIAPRLVYRAVPLGSELEPFLALLAAVSGTSANPLTVQMREMAARIRIPANLAIYIAPQCPFCPTAVQQIAPLALVCDLLTVTVIDALMFTEDAESRDIRSTPTVILEENLRWAGAVNIGDILRMIIDRNPEALGPSSLINMIENGDAVRLARMMLNARKIFPAYLKLLVHDKWPVRLGAMVALETIVEEDADLAASTIDPLWDRFHGVTDAVRGDILYIFGESGHNGAVKKLEEVLAGAYSDEVKEAAAEAMEKLSARMSR